jgi:hypothetical protein
MDNNRKEELKEKLNTLLKALEEVENMPDKDYEKEMLYREIAFTAHSQEGSTFYKVEMNCDIIILQ